MPCDARFIYTTHTATFSKERAAIGSAGYLAGDSNGHYM